MTTARYAATLYHDGEHDAAIDHKEIGLFPTLSAALCAINEQRGDHWQTGGIAYGHLSPAIIGLRPAHFDADDSLPAWFVGVDGLADR